MISAGIMVRAISKTWFGLPERGHHSELISDRHDCSFSPRLAGLILPSHKVAGCLAGAACLHDAVACIL